MLITFVISLLLTPNDSIVAGGYTLYDFNSFFFFLAIEICFLVQDVVYLGIKKTVGTLK